jgi:hypothetical protein
MVGWEERTAERNLKMTAKILRRKHLLKLFDHLPP